MAQTQTTHHRIARDRRRNKRLVTVPDRVGPHAKLFFSEVRRQGLRYQDVEDISGVRVASQKAWRRKNNPGLESMQAVLNTLGWSFTPTPAIEVLPPDIAGELATVAAKMKAGMPETFAALLQIAVQQHQRREVAIPQLAEIEADRAVRAEGKPKQRRAA